MGVHGLLTSPKICRRSNRWRGRSSRSTRVQSIAYSYWIGHRSYALSVSERALSGFNRNAHEPLHDLSSYPVTHITHNVHSRCRNHAYPHPTTSTLELLLRRTFGFLFCIRTLCPHILRYRVTSVLIDTSEFVYLVDTLVCSLINNETNSIKHQGLE